MEAILRESWNKGGGEREKGGKEWEKNGREEMAKR